MKLKTSLLLLLLILLAASLSACVGGGAATATSWPGLTVDENTAYVAYNREVRAIQLADGKLKWSFPEEPNNSTTFYANPAISPDGQLIVSSYNHVLYSLNPETGSTNWEFTDAGNRFIAGPLAVEQGIFAPDASEILYALDLEGKLRWTFTTEGESWSQPIADPDCECIYLGSMDHTVYALNPADGKLIWQTEGLGGAIVGIPVLGPGGVLYVGTFGSQVIAIDTQDGKKIWSAPTEGWVWAGPTLSDDRLYVGDLDGNFYAFDANTGQEVWQITADSLDGQIVGSPLVLEDRIYFTTEAGILYSLDKQGQNLASVEVGGKLYTSPVAAGDLILVAPVQAETSELLVALPKDVSQWQDGQSVWAYIPEENKK